jgi:phosphoglycolate phosphatase-like HAD superfamily hydrolase
VSSVQTQSGFRWDGCDAYLFDIDGTLLQAQGGVHFDAFASSVLDVLKCPLSLEGVPIHGNTDTGILQRAFELAAISETVWQPRMAEILEKMRAAVYERRHEMTIEVKPGVRAVLAHLKERGKTLGIATGNLEQIGWLKVELAGLREWFDFGGFSDSYSERAAMIRYSAGLARQFAGENAKVCVVGDTPSDIAAAKANSLPTIAVATGKYSLEELHEHAPEVCTETLEALLKGEALG